MSSWGKYLVDHRKRCLQGTTTSWEWSKVQGHGTILRVAPRFQNGKEDNR